MCSLLHFKARKVNMQSVPQKIKTATFYIKRPLEKAEKQKINTTIAGEVSLVSCFARPMLCYSTTPDHAFVSAVKGGDFLLD